MTTFAPATTPRYYHATIKGGTYGYELNEKAAFRAASSVIINRLVGGQPTGNISSVIGRTVERALICHLPRILSQPLAVGNNETAQMAPTCVRIKFSHKNKSSHFSLAESRIWVYNMSVTNSINEKSAQRLKHVETLITQRPLREARMSLFPAILPQSQVCDHWNPLNFWGFSS